MKNKRRIERAYTSTVIETNDEDGNKNEISDFINTKLDNIKYRTFSEEIQFFRFRDMKNNTPTPTDTTNSSLHANIITTTADNDLLITNNSRKTEDKIKSQSIFNKLGNKFGDTFRHNEEIDNSTGKMNLQANIFPSKQNFLQNIFAKQDNASKITNQNNITDNLGITEVRKKLEKLEISEKRKESEETILTSNGQNDSAKLPKSTIYNLNIPRSISRIEQETTMTTWENLNMAQKTGITKVEERKNNDKNDEKDKSDKNNKNDEQNKNNKIDESDAYDDTSSENSSSSKSSSDDEYSLNSDSSIYSSSSSSTKSSSNSSTSSLYSSHKRKHKSKSKNKRKQLIHKKKYNKRKHKKIRKNKERKLEKKATKLAASLIKNASRTNFRKLKIDNNPKVTRLHFMYFIEDLQNLLDMVYQLRNILQRYPEIQLPTEKHKYAKKSLFTLINTYSNSEVKSIIKEVHGDGCKALKLLQVRCACITPQDTVRIEEKFNNTRIEPSENATSYIWQFRDAQLLAKSVGMVITESNLIDKFLLSMTTNKKYFLTIQHLLTQ